ncbi:MULTISPECIES: DNA adenine methylase [Alphaproteobacteria]|uniref:DNA adenine methylase n=1 Tax=Alphaproteobacteria TaxID=28211 RepID=UPI00329A660B
MTFRYIGSKARVVDVISKRIGPPSGKGRFVDLFCGTGVVAEAAANLGWDVHLNDHLHSSVIMAAARLITPAQAKFTKLGGYERAVDALNGLAAKPGFIHREYSPASMDLIGLERRYFSTENAARIDAIRSEIEAWSKAGKLTLAEEHLLLADLLSATNRVANIAGTYGCFLSKWQSQALHPIALRVRDLFKGSGRVTVSVKDARAAPTKPDDFVYIDPPYTKRQYAAYYHLLETITLGDEPVVEGVAGLRPWQTKASDFCYRVRALRAFEKLIDHIPASRFLISYSDDAHVEIDALIVAMRKFGRVNPIQVKEIARYRPNQTASAGAASVSEYLIEVDRLAVEIAA